MRPETRAVIIAQRRSGSTMLCYGLSNHPEVFCPRGEPLHRQNSWRWAFGGTGTPWGREVYKRIIGLALSQYGYRTCAAKVNWGPGTAEVWDWLTTIDPPVRGIYLRRKNLLRQAVSEIIRRSTKGTKRPRVHEPDVDPPPLRMTAAEVQELMAFLEAEDVRARAILDARAIPYLSLTYRELVGQHVGSIVQIEDEASLQICDWLRVRQEPLCVWPQRRVNPWPLSRLVENWPALEAAVAGSRWAWCLEAEKERWS